MIRSSLIAFLFGFLLVIGQQQALEHHYAHSGGWQTKSSNNKDSTKHNEICGQCLAHAGIDSAINLQSQFIIFNDAQFERSIHSFYAIISACFFSYNSRAPPVIA